MNTKTHGKYKYIQIKNDQGVNEYRVCVYNKEFGWLDADLEPFATPEQAQYAVHQLDAFTLYQKYQKGI